MSSSERYDAIGEKGHGKKLKQIKKAMLDAARNLEFESAAEPRDHLHQLKKRYSAWRCWWEPEAVGLLNRLRAP